MIVLVGAYPPPYGGISIFIKRMKLYLDSLNIENRVWSLSKESRVPGIDKIRLRYLPFKIIFSKNINVIHYNITGSKSKIFIGIINILFLRKKKKIITNHGDCSNLFSKNKLLMRIALNSFDTIICVKKGDKKFLISNGIKKTIYEIPAIIYPVEAEKDFKLIPEVVWDFAKKSKFLICANGMIKFYNNEDLYGIDMLIELVKRLKQNLYDISLIIAVLGVKTQNEKEKIYYNELKNKITNYSLDSSIYIYESMDTELYPILKSSSLFIRPTNYDGYGISIAEALYYNVPGIGSDVCERPTGTVIFKSRDVEDLYKKVLDVINNYNFYKEIIKENKEDTCADKLLKIYGIN